eukprot:3259057-Rhodomonas_salina.1
MDYWMDQRLQGRPVPWIISHCLPRPQRAGSGATSHLRPTIPAGDSLWRVVTKIHSFDFQTDKYAVDMSTGSTSLTRWGTISLDKLAGTLCRAQAFYVPPSHLSHDSGHGRWWKCTGHRKVQIQGLSTMQFEGKWLSGTDDGVA